MTTPVPILAPKRRRSWRRTPERGCQEALKRGWPTQNHAACTQRGRPGEYQELLYRERSTCISVELGGEHTRNLQYTFQVQNGVGRGAPAHKDVRGGRLHADRTLRVGDFQERV